MVSQPMWTWALRLDDTQIMPRRACMKGIVSLHLHIASAGPHQIRSKNSYAIPGPLYGHNLLSHEMIRLSHGNSFSQWCLNSHHQRLDVSNAEMNAYQCSRDTSYQYKNILANYFILRLEVTQQKQRKMTCGVKPDDLAARIARVALSEPANTNTKRGHSAWLMPSKDHYTRNRKGICY